MVGVKDNVSTLTEVSDVFVLRVHNLLVMDWNVKVSHLIMYKNMPISSVPNSSKVHILKSINENCYYLNCITGENVRR